MKRYLGTDGGRRSLHTIFKDSRPAAHVRVHAPDGRGESCVRAATAWAFQPENDTRHLRALYTEDQYSPRG